jgi:hypothetical protein
MKETYIIKKSLNNRLFGESTSIPNETSKQKLINAYSFMLILSDSFNESNRKFGQKLTPSYDGFAIEDWQKDISTRIKELDTIYCFSSVTFTCISDGGIEYTLCDGTVVQSSCRFGVNVLKECIRKDSLKGFEDRKKPIRSATIRDVRYTFPCKGDVTTTTTTSK